MASDDDDDFLKFLDETSALANSDFDVNAKAQAIKADREQEFIDAFVVTAERAIRPVFLSVKERLRSPFIATPSGKGPGPVSLSIYRTLNSGDAISSSLTFSADRAKRMVTVTINEHPVKPRASDCGSQNDVELEKVTKDYVKGLIQPMVERLKG